MTMIVILVALALVAGFFYLRFVLGHMTAGAATIGKADMLDGRTGLAWVLTKLVGWKTLILGWLAAATQGVSFLLATDFSPFKDLPWEKLFSERIANYITFALALLMTMTHAQGFSRVAALPPQE